VGVFKDESPRQALLHIAFDELDMMADVRVLTGLMTGCACRVEIP
jgi:hypothetical protein